jgi:hypothetical protein
LEKVSVSLIDRERKRGYSIPSETQKTGGNIKCDTSPLIPFRGTQTSKIPGEEIQKA